MTPLYGITAVFDDADAAVRGVRAARAAGYVALDLHTPMPIEGLSEALGVRSRIARATFIGGLVGGLAILSFEGWAHAIDWFLNIGGRRPFAVTGFLVPTFELTILIGGLATFFTLILRCRLPRLHHPLFAVPGFERASQDRFFLVIEARDPNFDPAAVRSFLGRLCPLEVRDVPQ